jgi:hypothetical protein
VWLINNRNLLLTVLEPENSKIKATADFVSGESLLSGSKMVPSLYILTCKRDIFNSPYI